MTETIHQEPVQNQPTEQTGNFNQKTRKKNSQKTWITYKVVSEENRDQAVGNQVEIEAQQPTEVSRLEESVKATVNNTGNKNQKFV